MSLYRERTMTITDGQALVEVLKSKGFDPNVHHDPAPLVGFENRKRKERAHIIIPRKQVGRASNDIGFLREANGAYKAIISDFDRAHHKYDESWLKDVQAGVLEIVARRKINQFDVEQIGTRKVLPDGKIRLQFIKRS